MPHPLRYTIETIMGGNDRTAKRDLDDLALYAVLDWQDHEDPYKFVHIDRDECVEWLRRRDLPPFPTDVPSSPVACPVCVGRGGQGEIVLFCTGTFWWHAREIDDDGNVIFSGDRDDECNDDDFLQCLDCKITWAKPVQCDFT